MKKTKGKIVLIDKQSTVVIITLFLLLLLCSISSCSNDVHKRGLENYNVANSEISLSRYLFPIEDYIERFEYKYGNYYYDNVDFLSSKEVDKDFAYFVYTPDIFSEAYDFTMSEFCLIEDSIKEYNGYTFIEHLPYADCEKSEYPDKFWMVFYSKDRSVIGFISFYRNSGYKGIGADVDFETFLKTEYDMYNWDD